jgi:hypothetical protein
MKNYYNENEDEEDISPSLEIEEDTIQRIKDSNEDNLMFILESYAIPFPNEEFGTLKKILIENIKNGTILEYDILDSL